MAPPPLARVTLVLGGTRSGKSEVAESLVARAGGPVTYVATGRAVDDEMAARIATHQARRASDPEVAWTTVETDDEEAGLPRLLEQRSGAVLVDSLGTWVASFPDLDPDVEALCAALGKRAEAGAATVLVSEEVGMGVHPTTGVGRRFTDVLGELNRAVADVADQVVLVVAGRVLPLDRWNTL